MHSTIAGRYTLHELLGEGGTGAVYRATDRLNGTTVALKRVSLLPGPIPLLSQTDALRLAMANEFQTLASLRHPNIIGVLDYGFEVESPAGQKAVQPGQPYFTMEYLAGAQTILHSGLQRPVEARVDLLLQVLQALWYVHRRGIVHRDIKPGNLLVVSGEVKVLDFGLSVGRGQRVGTAGTVAYMAPEVLREGRPADEAADLYAVGIIAYELFAGHHPFDDLDLGRLLDRVLNSAPDLAALPVAPALREVVGRLLAKDPEQRYPSAEACMAALSQAVGREPPGETAAIRDSFIQAARFVGRGEEMGRLGAALQAAVAGAGSAWLVGGESGVGKTRLLDELATRALVAGALVLRGQAVREGGVAYQAWREPLRRLALSTQLGELEAGIVKTIVPDLGTLLGRPVPGVPAMEDQAGQQRLINTIVSIFRRHAAPIVLILEDLTSVSEDLDVLRQLVPTIAERPLLVAVSYRDDEDPAVATALPGAQAIDLQRLSAADVAELSASMLGEAGRQAELVALLQRESEGNTFFLVEIVRALAEEAGRLSEVGRRALPAHLFPRGVRALVGRRLERVPPGARRLLQAAAVAGREVDRPVLTCLAEGQALDIDEWLTACATAVVLEARDGRWRFAHDKLRDGLLARLTDAERIDLHRQVAVAIEATHPNDPERAAALAYHWGQVGDLERELRYARLAGEQAAAQFANADAIDYISRALALTPEADVDARLSLLSARELVYDRQGARQAQAKDLAALSTLAAALGDPGKRSQAALRRANYAEAIGDYPSMVGAAQEAISLARAAGDVGSEAHGHLWWGRALWYEGEHAAARPQVERALALVRRAAAESPSGQHGRWRVVEADSVRTLALVCGAQGDLVHRRDYLQQALHLHAMVGDRRGEGIVFNNLGDLCRCLGDYAGARAYFQQALQLLHEIGSRWVENIALYNLGMICNALDQYREGQDCFQESLRLCREIGDRRFEGYALSGLADGLVGLGRLTAAIDVYRQAIDIRRTLGQQHLVVESLAGLSRALWQAGTAPALRGSMAGASEQARATVDEILAYLEAGGSLEGTEEPFQVYLTCYKLLSAQGDPRARVILDTAYARLQAHAARIPDRRQRRSFLENVACHREIVAAAGQLP